jgi:hypothetical protein
MYSLNALLKLYIVSNILVGSQQMLLQDALPIVDSSSLTAGFSSFTNNLILWRGEMAPLPKKSPDLGNSSPRPRALMYNKS